MMAIWAVVSNEGAEVLADDFSSGEAAARGAGDRAVTPVNQMVEPDSLARQERKQRVVPGLGDAGPGG
jgi:hypothetical protein